MRAVGRAWALVLRFSEAICAALVLLIGAMVIYEIIARAAFDAPTIWVQECSVYLLVALAFFGLAATERAGEHIRIDLLTKRFNHRIRTGLEVVICIAVAVFASIAVWGGWQMVAQSFKFSRRSLTLLAVPAWIPQLVLPIGMTLLAIAMVWRVWHLLTRSEESGLR